MTDSCVISGSRRFANDVFTVLGCQRGVEWIVTYVLGTVRSAHSVFMCFIFI